MSLSLLLVEDDPQEARRLEGALAHLGYDVTLAGDGDAALARLQERAFDVMLLDLVLPGLDGRGVLSAMAERGIAVPAVVQVTPAGLDAAAGALRCGARDFVVKPAGALRLQVALANAVALANTLAVAARPAAPRAPAPVLGGNVVALHPAARAPMAADSATADSPDIAPLPLPLAAPAVAEPPAIARLEASGHARRLEQIEAEAIRFACHLYGGRIAEVARRLGIGRSTLYRKLATLEPEVAQAVTSVAVDCNLAVEPSPPRFVAAE